MIECDHTNVDHIITTGFIAIQLMQNGDHSHVLIRLIMHEVVRLAQVHPEFAYEANDRRCIAVKLNMVPASL